MGRHQLLSREEPVRRRQGFTSTDVRRQDSCVPSIPCQGIWGAIRRSGDWVGAGEVTSRVGVSTAVHVHSVCVCVCACVIKVALGWTVACVRATPLGRARQSGKNSPRKTAFIREPMVQRSFLKHGMGIHLKDRNTKLFKGDNCFLEWRQSATWRPPCTAGERFYTPL